MPDHTHALRIDAESPPVHAALVHQNQSAAYTVAQPPFPEVFGGFYESDSPSKNAPEKKWIDQTRETLGNRSDLDLLQKTFDRTR